MELDERTPADMAGTGTLAHSTAPVLLPHNEPAYDALERVLDSSNKAIVVSAMGTGKSYIAAKYIAEHGEKAVVVCPKRSIMQSWESLAPGIAAMTYQYLCRMRPEDLIALPYTCWIFDEAHHCCADKWRENIEFLMENVTGCKFIGLTADPVRHLDGGLDVSQELFDGNVVDGLDLHAAIQENVLPAFSYVSAVFGLEKALDDAREKTNAPGPNRYILADKITKLEDSLQNRYKICEILDKHMPEGKRKGIVFVDHIDSLPEAMDIMRDWAGNTAAFLTMHSRQSSTKTEAEMARFTEMEEGWMFAVDMLNEGLHFPCVNTVVMFRHTESPNVYFQQLGRSLAAKGEDPVIFDFVGNRKSLATKSATRMQGLLTGNPMERKHQSNIIIYDYANEALDLLDEINELLNEKWTDEEKEILRKYYPDEGSEIIKRLPGRTAEACCRIASTLGIKSNYNPPWTPEEEEILKKYYPTEGKKVAKRLENRSESACMCRASGTLGLNCDLNHGGSPWSDKEISILKEYYPLEGAQVSARLERHSAGACRIKASHLGLKVLSKSWTETEISILEKYYPDEGMNVAKRLPGRSAGSCKFMARKLGLKSYSKIWTDQECAILEQYFPTEGSNVAKRIPAHSADACRRKAKLCGLQFKAQLEHKWNDREIAILTEYYPKEGRDVAKRLKNHDVKSCCVKAHNLGLHLERSWRWTDEEISILRQYYPAEGSSVADRLPGRTTHSSKTKARELGLSFQPAK